MALPRALVRTLLRRVARVRAAADESAPHEADGVAADSQMRRSSDAERALITEEISVDVAAPKLTRFCAFADSDLEQGYRAVLRPHFVGAVLKLSIAVFALATPALVSNAFTRAYCPEVNLVLAVLLATPILGLLVISVLAWRVERISLRVVEWVSTACFSVIALRLIIFNPDRTMAMLCDPEWELPGRHGTLFVRGFAVMIATGLFTPINLVQYTVILCSVMGSFVLGEVLLPLDEPIVAELGDLAPSAIIVMVGLWLGVRHRMRTDRGQFHFRLQLIERARLWRVAKKGELEAEARAARAASNARARLIRVVMHDLRSPLLAVRNLADTLADMKPAAWPLREREIYRTLNALQTCTALMEGIVSDMLDFERIDSGRMVLVAQPFLLAHLLRDAELSQYPLAQRKGVRLVAEQLPPELEQACFVGDRRRLLQCLCNGLNNAIKFSHAGQTVTMSAQAMPLSPVREATPDEAGLLTGVDVVVADEGEGISAEELAVLDSGDAFSQVGRGQLQGNGGTGLGLNIVRQLLEMHNGSQLRLHSAGHGQGTSFTMALRLPVGVLTALNGAATSIRRSSTDFTHGSRVSGGESGQSPSVQLSTGTELSTLGFDSVPAAPEAAELAVPPVRCLHAEDDLMLQMTLGARLFTKEGVACDVAENGQAAVELVQAAIQRGQPYDLLVVDNQMPLLTGAEATKQIRELGFGGIIIGMTGDPTGSPDRADFESSGLDVCVDKTIEGMDVVSAHIAQLLERRDRRRRLSS